MDRGRRSRERAPNLFGLSQKQLRNVLRFCHLAFGMLLMPFIYSPLGDFRTFELVVQIAFSPLLVVTGISMWQQAKLRKLLAKGGQS
jgi:hypothetical protein